MQDGSSHQVTLRLLATSDIHVALHGHDYATGRAVAGHGLARVATLIAAARAEHAGPSVLLDCGDTIQGSLMGDCAAEAPVCGPHPAIAAMNALDYTGATVGNHDFNYGLPFLKSALSGARFPVVCCNVLTARGTTPDADRTLLPPWTIVRLDTAQGPLRLGLIGFAPPQITDWDHHRLRGAIATRDIVGAARHHVPRLRAAGADLVVALCHSGIAAPPREDDGENAAVALAAVAGIDALILGHAHEVFPGPAHAATASVDPVAGRLHGKPAVMPGVWGSHLGRIDLALTRSGGAWRVAGAAATCLAVARESGPPLPEAAVVRDAVAAAHARTLAFAARPVGRTPRPLSSGFSLLANDAYLTCLAEVCRRAARRLIAEREHPPLPVLAAVGPFKLGGRAGPDYFTNVPAGAVTLRQLADLYVFPNTLAVVRMTGAQIRAWLEIAASVYARQAGGQTRPMLSPQIPPYRFDVIDGLRYRIDLSRAAGRGRIRDLRHKGAPVRRDDAFLVATNSFRANSLIAQFGFAPDILLEETDLPIRDALGAALADPDFGRFMAATPPPPTWCFAPIPGARAWYDGPAGGPAPPDLPGAPRIRLCGRGAGGFARYGLDF